MQNDLCAKFLVGSSKRIGYIISFKESHGEIHYIHSHRNRFYRHRGNEEIYFMTLKKKSPQIMKYKRLGDMAITGVTNPFLFVFET